MTSCEENSYWVGQEVIHLYVIWRFVQCSKQPATGLLSWARKVHSPPFHLIPLRSTLILCSQNSRFLRGIYRLRVARPQVLCIYPAHLCIRTVIVCHFLYNRRIISSLYYMSSPMFASLLVLVALLYNYLALITVKRLPWNLKRLFILPAPCAYAYVFGLIL
jgi:hypothetical protein